MQLGPLLKRILVQSVVQFRPVSLVMHLLDAELVVAAVLGSFVIARAHV